MSNNDIIISLGNLIEMKRKKQQFKERLNNILELASEGVREFELQDEITIDTLLPDKKNKYIADDKTLILSNLLSDLACSIHALNTKIDELNDKVERLESHTEAFESYVNKNISDNKQLIETTINNLTTIREKYVKDEEAS